MEEDHLQSLFSEIQKAQTELSTIQGSLESMMSINTIVEGVSQTIAFKEKHIVHMKACDQVWFVHMQQLQTEQQKLINLLKTQQSELQRLLQIQRATCGSGN